MAVFEKRVFDRELTNELLRAVALRRDENAFNRLFEIFAGPMKMFLIKLGTDVHIAEEIVQEVMVTVWHKASQFDFARASVSTWLFAIARNRRIDVLKKEQRQLNYSNNHYFDEREVERPDSIVHSVLRDEKTRKAITELPPGQSLVLFKGVYEEKTHEQISNELCIPLGTVKSRRRLAFNRLRENLPGEISF